MPISVHDPRARNALTELLDELAAAAPEPLALVIYGSLALGTYRPGESDVNLAVVLHEPGTAVLDRLRAPLRAAWRAARVRPFVLGKDEIPRVADAFPIKLLHIQEHHQVIHGEDPFRDIAIDPAHLRLRVEQELRNHQLRLRRHYLMAGDDPRELSRAIFTSASSLSVELWALLRVAGTTVKGSEPDVVAAAAELGLDRGVLERVRAFKAGGSELDIPGLYTGLMALIDRAAALADALEVPA